ncbi:FitA-like ribbon-helix-helix domain-containing protein [Frigoribacterium sp. CFBP9030]|uniref:FitA-like ribbon-helix-helix domain-containing protein n=1 Tax=Frigoribacterium sp. CFBP9030 TaxID=3096537 RepID=UPI002A6A5AB3|nr:hypothetical protein [Frigoribacterium sp. CFBP9030]MDY0890391.1 hypothetical protein [Frigoribacterium sp. CFBP9030]
MSTVTVRGLDPDVVSGLKALSARHGRSMEAEVRWVLGRYVADAEFPTAEVVLEFDGTPGTPGAPGVAENWVVALRRRRAENDALLDDDFIEILERNRREQIPAKIVDFE